LAIGSQRAALGRVAREADIEKSNNVGLPRSSASRREAAALVSLEEDVDDLDLLAYHEPRQREADRIGKLASEGVRAFIPVGIDGDLLDEGVEGPIPHASSSKRARACPIWSRLADCARPSRRTKRSVEIDLMSSDFA